MNFVKKFFGRVKSFFSKKPVRFEVNEKGEEEVKKEFQKWIGAKK